MAGRIPREAWDALGKAHKDPWVWQQLPPAPGGKTPGFSLYPGILRELEKKLHLKSKIDFDSHGQGFASYVDAWFYREADEFRIRQAGIRESSFTGLAVTLWRFGPYYVLSEYPKSWHDGGGSGGMPAFSGIDHFATKAVRELSDRVEAFLKAKGLIRLQKGQLAKPLPEPYRDIPSNLARGERKLFDALFHWND